MREDLVARVRERSVLLEPLPTQLAARLQPLPSIRAVVFDVYGTMVLSGSGDISLASDTDRSVGLAESLAASGLRLVHPPASLWDRFRALVTADHQRARSEGIDFPEVEIRDIWENFLRDGRRDGWIVGEVDLERLALEYECTVNPVAPMPGLEGVLADLSARGQKLGIVSNAQFYTPLLFPALFQRTLEDFGFSPDLMIWSYREGRGKPSLFLFEKLAAQLGLQGISTGESLYVGNDMRNDIWPAAEVGMKTALFAGDRRSLRLREDHPEASQVVPDLVLTHWDQLSDLITAPPTSGRPGGR